MIMTSAIKENSLDNFCGYNLTHETSKEIAFEIQYDIKHAESNHINVVSIHKAHEVIQNHNFIQWEVDTSL